MLDFLKEQLANIEEQIKELYRRRANAGIEAVGSYDNMIKSKTAEYERLQKEIARFSTPTTESSTTSTPPPTPAPAADPKQHVINLVSSGKLQEAIKFMQEKWTDNSIILLSARIQSAEKQRDDGVISQADYGLARNRITNAILNTLKDL